MFTFEQAYIYFTYISIDIELWSVCVCALLLCLVSAPLQPAGLTHTHRGNPWVILTVHQLIQSTVCSTIVQLKDSARTTLLHIAFQRESKDKPSVRAVLFYTCVNRRTNFSFFLFLFFLLLLHQISGSYSTQCNMYGPKEKRKAVSFVVLLKHFEMMPCLQHERSIDCITIQTTVFFFILPSN